MESLVLPACAAIAALRQAGMAKFTSHMAQALAEARAAAGRAARIHVEANHSIQAEARALVRIYHDLLSQP